MVKSLFHSIILFSGRTKGTRCLFLVRHPNFVLVALCLASMQKNLRFLGFPDCRLAAPIAFFRGCFRRKPSNVSPKSLITFMEFNYYLGIGLLVYVPKQKHNSLFCHANIEALVSILLTIHVFRMN